MATMHTDTSYLAQGWHEAKPDDYKGGKELESALKAFEKLSKKVFGSAGPLPKWPGGTSISDYESYAGGLKSVADEVMDVVIPHYLSLKDAAAELAGVASNTSRDLRKQAKDKTGDDKTKYDEAAEVAWEISTTASGWIKEIK